jgi:riboflavin transporter FmnP
MTGVKKMVTGALFIAFGVILPAGFHFTGLPGWVFLPMHIPVLIAGMFLGGKSGFAVGVLTPFLSSVTTGMPAMMPSMPNAAVELGVYGLTGGYFYKNKNRPLLTSLLTAMLLGRIAAFITGCILLFTLDLKIDPLVYMGISTLYSTPGIIIQLFLIPLIVKKLETTVI